MTRGKVEAERAEGGMATVARGRTVVAVAVVMEEEVRVVMEGVEEGAAAKDLVAVVTDSVVAAVVMVGAAVTVEAGGQEQG